MCIFIVSKYKSCMSGPYIKVYLIISGSLNSAMCQKDKAGVLELTLVSDCSSDCRSST